MCLTRPWGCFGFSTDYPSFQPPLEYSNRYVTDSSPPKLVISLFPKVPQEWVELRNRRGSRSDIPTFVRSIHSEMDLFVFAAVQTYHQMIIFMLQVLEKMVLSSLDTWQKLHSFSLPKSSRNSYLFMVVSLSSWRCHRNILFVRELEPSISFPPGHRDNTLL